jgi:hypothetical protein
MVKFNNEKKTGPEMIGDYLREAAALIGPLGILEKVLTGNQITASYAYGVVLTSLAFLVFGITIEVSR